MSKYKLVAFMGESGAGKDTVQNAFCSKFPQVHKTVSTTTRPPRENEKEGVDYFFVSGEDFANKVLNFEMIEACDFRDWFYGTELKALDENKINVGVFNPDGIRALKEDDRIDLLVIYVIASHKTRIIRCLEREANPDVEEIFRRYKADEMDFSGLDFDFVPLINNGSKSMGELTDHVKHEVIKKFGQKRLLNLTK